MSNKKLVAEFSPDRFTAWRLWQSTPASKTDSGYSYTTQDPVTGSESGGAINQSDMDRFPELGKPLSLLLPATLWFLFDAGTEQQKLIGLAQSRPEMIMNVHSEVSLSRIINDAFEGKTPLLEVVKANKHEVVPDLLTIGASPTSDICVDPAVPIWTTAFAEALKADQIRILRHFIVAGVLQPKHLEACRAKYSAGRAGVPKEDAEHVNLLLEAVNALLERGQELPGTRESPSSERKPKVR
jgi:hypothetical protein